MAACLDDGAPSSPILHHGLLSILHPWSQALEDLQLEDVAAELPPWVRPPQ